MSNFLERIAASVTAPSEASRRSSRLQPTMGSIFMPRELHPATSIVRPASMTPEFTENLPLSRHRAESPLLSQPAVPSMSSTFEVVRESRDATSPRNEFDREGPLLPINRTQPPAQMRAADMRLRPDASTIPESAVTAKDSLGEAAKPAEPQAKNPQPDVFVRRTIQPVMVPPVLGNQARRSAHPQQPGRQSALPAQEPLNEVHIHIGRVEVAALAPPALRVPVQERRKSMSLDEYLRKFGHGGRG
ncbi:MAG TPA: hypothetical protein VGI45_28180 [Terracidiphilus sp.]|jgi:hypothetical protein